LQAGSIVTAEALLQLCDHFGKPAICAIHRIFQAKILEDLEESLLLVEETGDSSGASPPLSKRDGLRRGGIGRPGATNVVRDMKPGSEHLALVAHGQIFDASGQAIVDRLYNDALAKYFSW